jgi:H+/Cl- antiporter ClcA
MKRVSLWPRALMRSATAGFGFGFTLVFIQGLISAFMTPLPTIGAELFWDATLGAALGAVAGLVSAVVLTPMVLRPPP